MGDPELHGDEKILLTTQNVFVKSIPFEAVLTNKRIILVDRKKNLIPPKDILLATIRDIEGGENAIRDQIITLSLITNTGETRQLVLTFSRTAGGGRKRERDAWLKALKEQTSSSIQKAIRKVIPAFDQETLKKPPETGAQKIEITNRPAAKKEIEVAHPIKKIVETGTAPPKPVETTSLPTGSFCNRCGNRVPPESLFCNRCGAKVVGTEPGAAGAEPEVPRGPAESPLPVVAVPVAERKERPIEKEIRSIEPLIEGSVPRTAEIPPVEPSRPAETTPPAAESALAQAAQSIIAAAETGSIGEPTPPPAADVSSTPESGESRKRSIFPDLVLRWDVPRQPVPAGSPASPTPPPAAGGSGSRRGTLVTILVAVVVIIALAGGAFFSWTYLRGSGAGDGSGSPTSPDLTQITVPATTQTPIPVPTTPTPTPVLTTQATPVQTSVLIPQQGVWVRVNYPGTFKGTLGTAADQQPVSDTGDRFYSVPTSEGIVQAAIQKSDGSGGELVVEVYKNGSLIKRGTTTVPRGLVEIMADLRPPKTTATPTPTPSLPA